MSHTVLMGDRAHFSVVGGANQEMLTITRRGTRLIHCLRLIFFRKKRTYFFCAYAHERETFDLMGVIFEGHHNLVRILCAEDWEGHPLRKDYVIPDTYRGLKNVVY